MRCGKAQEFLSLEMDGMLPPDSTVALRKHLDSCAECRRFREDLLVGQRLLAATEPVLSDNFEWRLQLKLNQTLQAAAGQSDPVWEEPHRATWSWLRNFGAAASVGLAAMLTVAMLLGPGDGTRLDGTLVSPQLAATSESPAAGPAVAVSDREPLRREPWSASFGGNSLLRTVSAGGSALGAGRRTGLDLGYTWSGDSMEDLRTINRLVEQNRRLSHMLFQYQNELKKLRDQLDTARNDTLDLQLGQP